MSYKRGLTFLLYFTGSYSFVDMKISNNVGRINLIKIEVIVSGIR